jgi:hypothetical protein
MADKAFAIVRFDRQWSSQEDPTLFFKIKKIVRSSSEALSEVERLNKVSASEDSVYFWQGIDLDL